MPNERSTARAAGTLRFGVWGALFVVVLAALFFAAACTSSGDGESADEAGDDIGAAEAEAEALPTATSPPLPSPTPAIPDSGTGPIVVGAVMAQSGVMVKRDLPALEGVRLQINRLNENGGLLGRTVELLEMDTESRVGVTDRAATEMMAAGADLLLVSCDPVRAEPAIATAAEFGVLTFSVCGADEAWADMGDLVFSFSSSATHEGRVMAEWAMETGLGSAITLEDATNPDSEEFCRSFTSSYRELGGNVVYSDTFTFDSLDPFIDRLAERPVGVAAVVLCSHLPGGLNGAPMIIEVVRQRGIDAPILSGSGLDGGPTWFNIVNDLGTLYMVTPTSTHGDDPNPAVRAMVAAIDQDSLVPPSRGWTVFGADAIEAWAIAVDRSRSVEGVDVATELERFSDEALISSSVTFGPGEHMDPERQLRVVKVESGSAESIEVR